MYADDQDRLVTTLVTMLPSPPYDTYSDFSYGHGPLSTMQSIKYTMPSASRYDMTPYDDYGYSRHFSQPGVAFSSARTFSHSEGQSNSSSHKLVPAQRSSHSHGLAGVPVLPPLQVPDRSINEYQQHTRPVRAPTETHQQPKEEKVGGVAVHLDYSMDEMVDFVSEMAQGMYGTYTSKICLADIDMTRSVMNSKIAIHPDFRRYVNQVLTSTRLPSSTILLGLHYLTVRMTLLSARGKYTYGGGDVYNMLTTALLLGSKFLDDNTFQNRSWSDVSNISVKKLNALECDWLQDINWDMHFDPSDAKGFALWRRRWQTFQGLTSGKNVDSLAETMKRASLDNSFQRRQQTTFQPLSGNAQYITNYPEAGPAGYYHEHSAHWQAPRYDQWAPIRSGSEYSPSSASETEPNTPNYAMPHGIDHGALPSTYPSLKMPPSLHILPSNAPAQGYFAAQYNQHGTYCICAYCTSYCDRYATNYAFDQTVAG